MAFIKSKDRDTALNTLVRGGHHSFYDVDFSLSELISDDFSKLGRLIRKLGNVFYGVHVCAFVYHTGKQH